MEIHRTHRLRAWQQIVSIVTAAATIHLFAPDVGADSSGWLVVAHVVEVDLQTEHEFSRKAKPLILAIDDPLGAPGIEQGQHVRLIWTHDDRKAHEQSDHGGQDSFWLHMFDSRIVSDDDIERYVNDNTAIFRLMPSSMFGVALMEWALFGDAWWPHYDQKYPVWSDQTEFDEYVSIGRKMNALREMNRASQFRALSSWVADDQLLVSAWAAATLISRAAEAWPDHGMAEFLQGDNLGVGAEMVADHHLCRLIPDAWLDSELRMQRIERWLQSESEHVLSKAFDRVSAASRRGHLQVPPDLMLEWHDGLMSNPAATSKIRSRGLGFVQVAAKESGDAGLLLSRLMRVVKLADDPEVAMRAIRIITRETPHSEHAELVLRSVAEPRFEEFQLSAWLDRACEHWRNAPR